MLISYDPMSDVLSITVKAAPVANTQEQGANSVGYDAAGEVVSVSVPDASTVLFQHGGQVNVMLPDAKK